MTTVAALLGPEEDVKATLTGAIDGKLPNVAGLTPEAVADGIWQLLSLNIEDLLTVAWDRHEEIAKAKAATLGHAGQPVLVEMPRVKLTSSHKPKVEVDAGPTSLKVVELDLTFSLEMELAAVTVESGEVRRVAPSEAKAEVKLVLDFPVFGKVPLFDEKRTVKLDGTEVPEPALEPNIPPPMPQDLTA